MLPSMAALDLPVSACWHSGWGRPVGLEDTAAAAVERQPRSLASCSRRHLLGTPE